MQNVSAADFERLLMVALGVGALGCCVLAFVI